MRIINILNIDILCTSFTDLWDPHLHGYTTHVKILGEMIFIHISYYISEYRKIFDCKCLILSLVSPVNVENKFLIIIYQQCDHVGTEIYMVTRKYPILFALQK
uniref:Uncharacterized protein n=1 Tax=Cacopsylla melanoneura TaxID=428564 RepID=A0A8D8ZFX4_9HEMI